MILLIDNYDSFTWNLVQRFGEIDPTLDLRVVRNDKITVDEARGMKGLRGVIISPGPCTPDEAGVSKDFVSAMAGEVPMLGVCLGHQCMGQMHGMRVVRHTKIMHGKTSPVHHDGRGIYRGMSDPFVATRYHSLVVLTGDAVPHGWEVSAWTKDVLADGSEARVVMGLRRVGRAGEAPMEGVQFHPESFLTEEGPRLLGNFLAMVREWDGAATA
ncbi:MAG: aminodeoxychorismate/anthranilate synthase component II [Phycisphaeraceae bacterium]|nr:aminodeoxychorismate/anthranilate synthase component II [Phycisphaeraceae bacterium]